MTEFLGNFWLKSSRGVKSTVFIYKGSDCITADDIMLYLKRLYSEIYFYMHRDRGCIIKITGCIIFM